MTCAQARQCLHTIAYPVKFFCGGVLFVCAIVMTGFAIDFGQNGFKYYNEPNGAVSCTFRGVTDCTPVCIPGSACLDGMNGTAMWQCSTASAAPVAVNYLQRINPCSEQCCGKFTIGHTYPCNDWRVDISKFACNALGKINVYSQSTAAILGPLGAILLLLVPLAMISMALEYRKQFAALNTPS